MLSGLAGRSELSRKNSRQPSGNGIMIGRLTANQAATAATAALPRSTKRLRRMATTSRAPKRNSGYSLAATPIPRTTPAQTGLLRAHSRSATDANATAIRS